MPQAKPKAKRVGRPRLPKGSAKAGRLQVRLSPDEQKKIEMAARASNQTVSDWARGILLATVGA
jgi:predicted HicB family RNase H-like nuclease